MGFNETLVTVLGGGQTAIPLSSITIVGGAIANFVVNVQRTQKYLSEPLIDWDFILMMQPMLLRTSRL